jgi:hypothetical protein
MNSNKIYILNNVFPLKNEVAKTGLASLDERDYDSKNEKND